MNSLLVSVAVLAIHSAQQGSLLQEVVPRPTGQNGYEDFLAAVDSLGYSKDDERRMPIDFYMSWSPNAYENLVALAKTPPPPDLPKEDLAWFEARKPKPAELELAKRLDSLTALEVKREMVETFKTTLALVKRGLAKRVWSPPRKRDLFDDIPELTGFRRIGRLMDARATVSLADGKPNEAASMLVDMMLFASAFREQSFVHSETANSIQTISLATIEKHLDGLPLAACKRLAEIADSAFYDNRAIARTLTNETESSVAMIIDMAFDPKNFEGMEDDPESKHLLIQLKSLTPQRRANLERLMRVQGQEQLRVSLRKLERPESAWTKEPPEQPETVDDKAPRTLEEAILGATQFFDGSDDQLFASFARQRCQSRLLWLHSMVLKHRWESGSLPNSLSEVAEKQRIQDPLSGGEFVLERVGLHGYRLYSRGSAETGEVDLRYRRPRTQESGPTPPPKF